MSQEEQKLENKTKDIKLYSSKSIGGATFLGGPLAAGYLISENLKALNKPDEGRKSLIIGILVTIVLFGGMFMIPEKIIDKIPNQLFPLIYTGIIWVIVERTQGEILKTHKENGYSFFSGWRAAGIGFISLLILGVGIFGYAYIESNNPALEIYDKEIFKFQKNDDESLSLYNNARLRDTTHQIKVIGKSIIPKWEENIKIIKGLNLVENMPSELLDRNKIILRYAELRLESYLLLNKAMVENTDKYNVKIRLLNSEINSQLDKLE